MEGIGHTARANYRLSQILEDTGKKEESSAHFERYISLKQWLVELEGDYATMRKSEHTFDNLVPWMLW